MSNRNIKRVNLSFFGEKLKHMLFWRKAIFYRYMKVYCSITYWRKQLN